MEYNTTSLIESDKSKTDSEKINELYKVVCLMKKEIDSLKKNTADTKYLVCIDFPLKGTDNFKFRQETFFEQRTIDRFVDVRCIDSIIVYLIQNTKRNSLSIQIGGQGIRIHYDSGPENIPDINTEFKHLEFLNRLTEYTGSIRMFGINLFPFIKNCRKIRKLYINMCDDITDISPILDFPELDEIRIDNSQNIQNIHLLNECKNLKELRIDTIYANTFFDTRINVYS